MKNVLITNMYAGLGGGEVALLDHVESLKKRGVNVSVVLLEHGPFEGRLKENGISYRIIPFVWKGNKVLSLVSIASCIYRIYRIVRNIKADVVVSYTLNDLIFSGIVSRATGVPLVYRSQADVVGVDKDINSTWLGHRFLKVLKWISPSVVATTQGETNRLLELGFNASKVWTVYLGIDSEKFVEASKEKYRLRDEYGIGESCVLYAIFGRLVEWKGQKEFINAMSKLTGEGSIAGWIVGGSGFGGGVAYEEELRALIYEKNLQGIVKLMGQRDNIHELMAVSDVVVHASHAEPFGMVVIEAMMSGTAVIASDVSGPRESVIDGETGLLSVPKNIEMLFENMKTLLKKEEQRKKFGMSGQERAIELFDKDRNLEKLNEILESLCK